METYKGLCLFVEYVADLWRLVDVGGGLCWFWECYRDLRS